MAQGWVIAWIGRLILFVCVNSVSSQSTACDPTRCQVCDENNYCIECRPGFWLSLLEPGAPDGYCQECSPGCLECISTGACLVCESTSAQFTADCPICQKGCSSCDYFSDNCTSCISDYKLDKTHQTCYFKYTLHLIVGGALGICILILLLRCLFKWILAPRKPKKYPLSVLDMDTARNTYYVNDVIKIGQTEEKDISRVESRNADYVRLNPQGSQIKSFLQDQSTDHATKEFQKSDEKSRFPK